LNLAEKTKQSKTTLKSIHQLNHSSSLKRNPIKLEFKQLNHSSSLKRYPIKLEFHSSSLKGNPIKLEFKVKIGCSTLKLVASASAS